MMKQARRGCSALLGFSLAVGCESSSEPAPLGAAGGRSPSGAAASSTSGAAELERTWIPFAEDLPLRARQVDYGQLCSAEQPCPTLEQALLLSECSAPTFGPVLLSSQHPQVVTGCGLIELHLPGSATYWYEGFGSQPVAVADWRGSDIGTARYAASRSLACDRDEQTICSICGDGYPACGELSTWLPALPPPPEGCACEPDGRGGARVSLDCFCSHYGCPSYSAVVHDCDGEPFDRRFGMRRAWDGCGQTSFESEGSSHTFEASSGELVAAEFSFDLPFAWPCFTTRISAGTAADCAAPTDCRCSSAGDSASAEPAASRCDDASWFQALVSRLPDETPPPEAIWPDRPDTPPQAPGIEVDGCQLEYLGDWISCDDQGNRRAEVLYASFDDCVRACLDRPECSAVLDYLWLDDPRADLQCYLYVGSCEAPTSGFWQEEDAGRYYRKVCSG